MPSDIGSIVKDNQISVFVISPNAYSKNMQDISRAVIGLKKVVCYVSLNKPYNTIDADLKKAGITTLFITSSSDNEHSTQDGISEYICDGIINLRVRKMGKAYLRTIEIMKMRSSKVMGGIHGFKITDNGIIVEE